MRRHILFSCDGDDYRVCNVAIEVGADWRTLPEELVIDGPFRKEKGSGQRDVRYSRIDGSGHFRTATTTVAPNSQGSTVIHPTVRHSLYFFLAMLQRLN
jgi:hypothetical protein